MYFFGEGVGIQLSVLAGCSLAGNHRTNLGTRTAGFQTRSGKEIPKILYSFIRNAHDFHGKSGGHYHVTVSVKGCGIRDTSVFFRCHLTVSCNDADIKIIGSLVMQASQCLYPGNILRRHRHPLRRISGAYYIKEGRALQHLRIGITIML